MLSVTWAYGGFVGLGILVAFALTVVLTVAVLAGVALAAWIVANALLDIVPPLRVPSYARLRLRGTRNAL